MWGRDRGMRRGGLAQLLERLHEIDGLEWIRLLYLYPATVDRELVDAIARPAEGLQVHGHAAAARASGGVARDAAPGNGERYLEIIDEFRSRVPGITMRSTFIVGFPGERDEHVEYLEEWIERARARSRRLLRIQRRGRNAGGDARARR